MRVTNSTMFQGNPYHDLLYSALAGRYHPKKGTVDDAVAAARRGEGRLLHMHWEENPLRKCKTRTEARLVKDRISASLAEFKGLDGKLVWTLHNRLPHELEFTDELIGLRQAIAEHADRILVHSTAAIMTLREQIDVAFSRIMLLPHPSYADIYPKYDDSLPLKRSGSDVLFFGLIREYKGLDLLVEAIDRPYEICPDFSLRIRGDVLPGDPYAKTVESYADRPGIDLKIGRVSEDYVEPMFRSVRAVVMPYQRFLTSGVAMLALTFGTPVIAPDTPQMRELLPEENADLLFESGNAASLRERLRLVTSLSGAEIDTIVAANKARAELLHPHRISSQLGELYDSLISR